jgi:hypothetical protein
MDLTREQPQPGSTPEQPAAAPAAPYPPVSRLVVGERLARLLLHRLARLGARLWLLLRPRLGWLLLTSFLLGVIAVLSLMLIVPRLVGAASDPGDARVALIQPADAVVDFLRGQQTYDADLMWQSFSPELRSALEEQAITRDTLAEQVESERQAGQRYRSFDYVGGVELDSRQKMFFYVVEVQSPAPERSGTFSFVFTVDSNGKIISVEM